MSSYVSAYDTVISTVYICIYTVISTLQHHGVVHLGLRVLSQQHLPPVQTLVLAALYCLLSMPPRNNTL